MRFRKNRRGYFLPTTTTNSRNPHRLGKRRRYLRSLVGVKITSVTLSCIVALLAGCAGTNVAPSGSNNAADFKACMLMGSVEESASNQLADQALEDVKKRLGITVLKEQVSADQQLHQAIAAQISQNCNVIIGVGDQFVSAMQSEAKYHRDRQFAVFVSAEEQTNAVRNNFSIIKFDYNQVAFVAGYLAAGTSASRQVGVIAGHESAVTRQLVSAFVQGVSYFNQQAKASQRVRVSNANRDGQTVFLGDSPSSEQLQDAVEQRLEAENDVIFLANEASDSAVLEVVRKYNRARQKASATPTLSSESNGDQANGLQGSSESQVPLTLLESGENIQETSSAARQVQTSDALNAVTVIWHGTQENPAPAEEGLPILTALTPEFSTMLLKTVEAAKQHLFSQNSTQVIANYQTQGVSLSPFEQFDSTVPNKVKRAIQTLQEHFKAGSLEVEMLDSAGQAPQ